jgi:hypothetical protein
MGSEQARADCEIDVEAGELRAEGACLRSPSRGQLDGLGRVRVEDVCGIRRRFGVPRKDEQAEHVGRHSPASFRRDAPEVSRDHGERLSPDSGDLASI